ncbi:hypothetical protein F4827_003077 [Paraburkholderia bannensis]|uniref:Uncharacterized protein n=1 Tax=Paraburkholderia bannensis TaxID=765414 RepID=A0A7W9TXJ1_9BURK|nr:MULTISPECIES: hypothetical protein [Paraburkholderia]MBB3258209.1 hypothetical protein [Paraburkholderia sp. WP4_3_2]MBB6103222.1 hypothetical protein [Paraburkholderia bannensis]
MIGWLKHLIAGRELDELQRWRVEARETQRWLGEFHEVDVALTHLINRATGKVTSFDLPRTRAALRERRVGVHISVSTNASATASHGSKRVPVWMNELRAQKGLAPVETLDQVTDWEVAQSIERDGGRIAYRFLGVTGEEEP